MNGSTPRRVYTRRVIWKRPLAAGVRSMRRWRGG